MKTVKEVSRITGVSVRTLHHYDAIGLLKPTAVTEAGYRLYDDAALERMQSILFFRELQFPLKEQKAALPIFALFFRLSLLVLFSLYIMNFIPFYRGFLDFFVNILYSCHVSLDFLSAPGLSTGTPASL